MGCTALLRRRGQRGEREAATVQHARALDARMVICDSASCGASPLRRDCSRGVPAFHASSRCTGPSEPHMGVLHSAARCAQATQCHCRQHRRRQSSTRVQRSHHLRASMGLRERGPCRRGPLRCHRRYHSAAPRRHLRAADAVDDRLGLQRARCAGWPRRTWRTPFLAAMCRARERCTARRRGARSATSVQLMVCRAWRRRGCAPGRPRRALSSRDGHAAARAVAHAAAGERRAALARMRACLRNNVTQRIPDRYARPLAGRRGCSRGGRAKPLPCPLTQADEHSRTQAAAAAKSRLAAPGLGALLGVATARSEEGRRTVARSAEVHRGEARGLYVVYVG
mmetsp:Transcript_53214/g.122274  ORF Transcript_53214/g.122274 Transcript_53214/m.122274 type:complete len:340 (-) Transcript_53214:79-1098(-)